LPILKRRGSVPLFEKGGGFKTEHSTAENGKKNLKEGMRGEEKINHGVSTKNPGFVPEGSEWTA